jgi:quercetin dioxygenase-like cupin family protein
MIRRWTGQGWEGVEKTEYKDEPGIWMKVSREALFESPHAAFHSRCFRIAPGGCTSYEKHEHEHFVLVLSGHGRARLGDESSRIGPRDIIAVAPWQPHQFLADEDEGLDILCVVNAVRDRPVLLQHFSASDASEHLQE